MADLPTLPEAVQRKLTLKWESLIEKCGFAGEHLKLHEAQRSLLARPVARSVDSRPGHLKSSYEGLIDQAGIPETTRLATERFSDVAEEYLKIWLSAVAPHARVFAHWLDEIRSSVLREIAHLWEGSDWHVAWFERTGDATPPV